MAKNYMEELLAALRDEHGLSDKTLEVVRAELIRSFKNGIMRGRELAQNPKGRASKSTGERA